MEYTVDKKTVESLGDKLDQLQKSLNDNEKVLLASVIKGSAGTRGWQAAVRADQGYFRKIPIGRRSCHHMTWSRRDCTKALRPRLHAASEWSMRAMALRRAAKQSGSIAVPTISAISARALVTGMAGR